MANSHLYWRRYVRDDTNDVDTIADDAFKTQFFNDYFGQFLQQGSNADALHFDAVVSQFWEMGKSGGCTLKIFVVADGAFVPQSTVPLIDGKAWFFPHVRLLARVDAIKGYKKHCLFIVGPADVKSPDGFLQVASWDGRTFRFYGVEPINGSKTKGWMFQGQSADAFNNNPDDPHSAEYLGPFNGHVNGATVMKELHEPWYHWYNGGDAFLDCIPEDKKKILKDTPYITAPGMKCFFGARVGLANELEPSIESRITDWYGTRVELDFVDIRDATKKTPKQNPSNVHRWMAHILLNTSANFATARWDGNNSKYTAPKDHFYNSELFSADSDLNDIIGSTGDFDFSFDLNTYHRVRDKLQLSLLQEFDETPPPELESRTHILPKGTLGGGKQTGQQDTVIFVEARSRHEGIPFVVIQTAYEDAQGILYARGLSGSYGPKYPENLLSDQAVKALLMLDFWNPVYSWRRGVLMQYIPKVVSLVSGPNPEYDLEQQFVEAIASSTHALNDPQSPEAQFTQLYQTGTNEDYKEKISAYLSRVDEQLKTEKGLEDYLRLAESRRRIFRPLPLDEFGVQLPYALGIKADEPLIEMTETGTVVSMPVRGVNFINKWTGSLHGYDPKLIPVGTFSTEDSSAMTAEMSVMSTDMNSTTAAMVDDKFDFAGLPSSNSSRCPVTAAPKAKAQIARAAQCPVLSRS